MKYQITLTRHTVPCPPEQVFAFNHSLKLLAGLVRKQIEKERPAQPELLVKAEPPLLELSVHSPTLSDPFGL